MFTQLLVQRRADARQQRQCDEVTQAGSDGRGHVVWIDAHFSGANDHTNHDQACGQRYENKEMKLQY